MVMKNQVEWALHCCSVLAALPPGEYLPTKKLAEFHGVSKEYLSKALQALAQAGLIEGTLGPTGGYRLTRSPDKITFLDITEAVEGTRNTFECTNIRANNPCLKKTEKTFAKTCAVARVMYQADEAWRRELRAVTLADLLATVGRDVSREILERGQAWLRSK